MIKYWRTFYSWKVVNPKIRRISWTHQSFGNVGYLDGKILGFIENPIL
jgi:hypothetical protein